VPATWSPSDTCIVCKSSSSFAAVVRFMRHISPAKAVSGKEGELLPMSREMNQCQCTGNVDFENEEIELVIAYADDFVECN
jgi:hypothetical protein